MSRVFASIYKGFFAVPGVLAEPMVTIGHKSVFDDEMAEVFPDVPFRYGTHNITIIDKFDGRADYQIDLNEPIPAKLCGAFKSLIDAGTLEHIFDTRTCLENYFRMVQVGGMILLVTPIRGYGDHGFHTFSAELINSALRENGFEIIRTRYGVRGVGPTSQPYQHEHVIIWVLAKKLKEMPAFVCPQQGLWHRMYRQTRK